SFRVTSTEEKASRFMESIAVQTGQVKRIMLLILALTEGSENVDRESLTEGLESSIETLETEYKNLLTNVVNPREFDWSLVRIAKGADEDSSAYIVLQHHLANLIHWARRFTDEGGAYPQSSFSEARDHVFNTETLILGYLTELNRVYRNYVQA